MTLMQHELVLPVSKDQAVTLPVSKDQAVTKMIQFHTNQVIQSDMLLTSVLALVFTHKVA